MSLSVVIATMNEERNLPGMLETVKWADEIVVVDSASADRTVEIARSFGAKVFVEVSSAAQAKNSAIDKATGDWILSLDADEHVSEALHAEIKDVLAKDQGFDGYWIPRLNYVFGRPIRHGGFWPDPKIRLFRRGRGRVEDRPVHESVLVDGSLGRLREPILHYAYPTVSGYIRTMNRYSSLGADLVAAKGRRRLVIKDIVFRPALTFIYNYIFRLGFLDGHEGFLLHVGHATYVSWKYMKVWEMQNTSDGAAQRSST